MSVSPKMQFGRQSHFMNGIEKSEVSLNIKNSYASKYEVPMLDRTLSDENFGERPLEQMPVSPIAMGQSTRFTDVNPAETSRFGGVAQQDSNSKSNISASK
jgi:hypothetical protein